MFLGRNGKGKPAAGKNERNPGETGLNLLYDRGDLIRISQIKEKEPLPCGILQNWNREQRGRSWGKMEKT